MKKKDEEEVNDPNTMSPSEATNHEAQDASTLPTAICLTASTREELFEQFEAMKKEHTSEVCIAGCVARKDDGDYIMRIDHI